MSGIHLTRVRVDGVVVEQPVARLRLGDGIGVTEANGIVTLTLGSLQQASAEATTVKFETLQLTNPLDEVYGGTGTASYAAGDLLVATSSHTLSKRTVGSTGTFLRVSSSGEPNWSSLSLPSSGSSGTVLFISTTNAATLVHVEDALRTTYDAGSSTTGTWAPDYNNGPVQKRASTAANLTVTLPSNMNSGQVLNVRTYVAGGNVTFASTDYEGPALTFTGYDRVWASVVHFGESKYAVLAGGTTST